MSRLLIHANVCKCNVDKHNKTNAEAGEEQLRLPSHIFQKQLLLGDYVCELYKAGCTYY